MPPKKILVVEDHVLIRRGLRAIVESRPDYEIVGECSTGREALDVARRTEPDIAILDYSLPELNGIDLTVELRRMLPDLEVVLYTMYEREDLFIDALQAGVRAIVVKTDSEGQLLAAVESVARHEPHFSGIVNEMMLMHLLQEPGHGSPGPLSHRQREVVQLIAEGKLNKQIAQILNISLKTVESHRASAMQKLEVRSTAELVRYAIRNNMTGQ